MAKLDETVLEKLSTNYTYFEIEAMSIQTKSFVKAKLINKVDENTYLYNNKEYDLANLLLFLLEDAREFKKLLFRWEKSLTNLRELKVANY